MIRILLCLITLLEFNYTKTIKSTGNTDSANDNNPTPEQINIIRTSSAKLESLATILSNATNTENNIEQEKNKTEIRKKILEFIDTRTQKKLTSNKPYFQTLTGGINVFESIEGKKNHDIYLFALEYVEKLKNIQNTITEAIENQPKKDESSEDKSLSIKNTLSKLLEEYNQLNIKNDTLGKKFLDMTLNNHTNTDNQNIYIKFIEKLPEISTAVKTGNKNQLKDLLIESFSDEITKKAINNFIDQEIEKVKNKQDAENKLIDDFKKGNGQKFFDENNIHNLKDNMQKYLKNGGTKEELKILIEKNCPDPELEGTFRKILKKLKIDTIFEKIGLLTPQTDYKKIFSDAVDLIDGDITDAKNNLSNPAKDAILTTKHTRSNSADGSLPSRFNNSTGFNAPDNTPGPKEPDDNSDYENPDDKSNDENPDDRYIDAEPDLINLEPE